MQMVIYPSSLELELLVAVVFNELDVAMVEVMAPDVEVVLSLVVAVPEVVLVDRSVVEEATLVVGPSVDEAIVLADVVV